MLSNSKSVKVTKNVIDFKLRKWNLIFRFPNRIKIIPIDSVFSNWVNFIKQMSITNFLSFSMSFKTVYLFTLKFDFFAV